MMPSAGAWLMLARLLTMTTRPVPLRRRSVN